MLIDTAAIWYRLRVLHFYDREAAPATPLSERLRLEPLVLWGSAGRTWLPPPREGGGAPDGVRGARRETSQRRSMASAVRLGSVVTGLSHSSRNRRTEVQRSRLGHA